MFAWSRWTRWPGLLATFCLLAGAAPAQDGAAAGSEERVRVLLFPLVVHSSENPAYLRRGLGDMLAARLEQIELFEVERIERKDDATTRVERALELGRDAQVDFVIFGSFTRFGQGASLDIQVASVEDGPGEVPMRQIFVQSGQLADVIPDLDGLVGKISRFAVVDFDNRLAALRAEQAAREAAAREGADYPKSVRELQLRIEALETAIRQLAPDSDADVANPTPADRDAGAAAIEQGGPALARSAGGFR